MKTEVSKVSRSRLGCDWMARRHLKSLTAFNALSLSPRMAEHCRHLRTGVALWMSSLGAWMSVSIDVPHETTC